MTTLGKWVIIGGILIFTFGTLLWIVKEDWHWFAGGGTLFLASVLTSAVLSAETKQSPSRNGGGVQYRPQPQEKQKLEYDPERTDPQTQTLPRIQDDWQQPSHPPPDQEDKDAWT